MSAQLKALLLKLEADDVAILQAELVPAIFAEIQTVSSGNATVSAIESVVFSAVEPAAAAAFSSLLAKLIPVPTAT